MTATSPACSDTLSLHDALPIFPLGRLEDEEAPVYAPEVEPDDERDQRRPRACAHPPHRDEPRHASADEGEIGRASCREREKTSKAAAHCFSIKSKKEIERHSKT